jgi:hypothetical protein
MNEVLVALSFAYAFLAALLLLALAYGRLPMWCKLGLVLVSLGFYWVSYQGWSESQGWPSNKPFPKRFLLHSAVIEEPDSDLGTKGRIFVWASDLDGNVPADTPRAYVIGYDQRLHTTIANALRKMKSGNLQIGEVGGELFDPQATRDPNRIADKKIDLEFTDLPEPQLPEK